MKKNFTIIRDIDEIEKELEKSLAGALALKLKEGGYYQIATNFVYLDKNIFVALNKEDEKFHNIKFDSIAHFITYNSYLENNSDYNYQIKYISIIGEFREVTDTKQIEIVMESFFNKFSKDVEITDYPMPSNLLLCMLDSKEIQFVVESGK